MSYQDFKSSFNCLKSRYSNYIEHIYSNNDNFYSIYNDLYNNPKTFYNIININDNDDDIYYKIFDCIVRYMINCYKKYYLNAFCLNLSNKTKKKTLNLIKHNLYYIINDYYFIQFKNMFNIFIINNNVIISVNKLNCIIDDEDDDEINFVDVINQILFIAEFLLIYNKSINVNDFIDDEEFIIYKICNKLIDDNKMIFEYVEPEDEEQVEFYYDYDSHCYDVFIY